MAAFDAARKQNFDLAIKEEATYNYIKVLIDKGNNQQAIVDLQSYVKNYPEGKYIDETNELLSEILFETSNYASAITYIESLKRTTPKIDQAYQKLAFNQGVIEFNSEKFPAAITYFDKSLSKPILRDIENKAKFWKAEALFVDSPRLSESLYRDLLTSSDKTVRLKSQYSLAYIYFNDGKHQEALKLFQDFKNAAKGDAALSESVDDATLRIGDAQVATKSYTQAINTYEDAYRNNKVGKDYALYQKGLVLKYIGKDAEAKNAFDTFARTFSNSRLIDEVLFQNGNIAMEGGNYPAAINTFTELLRTKPNTEIAPHVLLRRGIAYTNVENYDKAITDFKLILNKFGKTEFAQEAFLGIRDALSASNRSEEFFEIAEQYKKNNPEGTSVQGMQFETAKELFYNDQFDKAISALTKFKSQYPSSVLIPEANFLLAEAYEELNNKNEALKYYQEIVMGNQLEFLAQAAMRSANIYFGTKKYNEAIQNYLQVISTTAQQRDNILAMEGLVKSYYETKNYDKVLEYAQRISDAGGSVVVGAVNRAELFKGKAFMGKSDFVEAKKSFEKTMSLAKDEAAAEAKYRIGEMQYLRKEYDASIKTLQELGQTYSDFLLWYENGFLLIADNYLAKNDVFMAKATLNSIIEYSQNKETVAKAKQKLNSIK